MLRSMPHAVAADEALLRSPRFRLALFLFLMNYVMGWPAVALIGAVSVAYDAERVGVVGSSVSYAFSWALIGAAILVGGRDVTAVGRRWVARKLGRG